MWRRSFVGLVFLAGLVWLGLLAYARLDGSYRPWPIELLDTFALYAFAPFLAVALVAIAVRSPLLLGLLAVAGVLFWQQFGHLLLPGPVSAAPAGPTIRVLTQNVLYKNRDAEELVALVRAEQPDVILLQELTDEFSDDLAKRLGRDYPHRVLTETHSRDNGSGTFSRLPIREAEEFHLTQRGNAHQRLRLAVGGREIWLYNVHLATPRLQTRNPPGLVPPLVRGFGSSRREEELQQLIEETQGLEQPYILAGDFNLAAGSRPYREFPAEWRDAFAERGWGLGHTFPTHYELWRGRITISSPLVRIDYILSSPEIAPLSARVLRVERSDHLPVLAELALLSPE